VATLVNDRENFPTFVGGVEAGAERGEAGAVGAHAVAVAVDLQDGVVRAWSCARITAPGVLSDSVV
jgi:hypothetical protein